MTVIFPKCQSGKYARSGIPYFIPAILFTPYIVIAYLMRRGADKSLSRPTSRCRRTESIVSLERDVCSCVELKVFPCYRGWKEACHAMRAISTTWRRELSDSHLLPGLKKKPIEWSPFFVRSGGHCCCEDLIGRTNFWFLFLSGLQILEQRAKKCIELSWEYVE